MLIRQILMPCAAFKGYVSPIGGSLPPLQRATAPWTSALTWPLHHCRHLRCCAVNREAPRIDSQTLHGLDPLWGYCLTNGALWRRDDNGSSLFRQHKTRAPERFRCICQNVITSKPRSRPKGNYIPFRTLGFLWLGCFCPTAWQMEHFDDWAGMFQTSAGARYSLDKQVWTFWTQTQKHPSRIPHPPPCWWLGSVCVFRATSGCLFAWHLSSLACFPLDPISHRGDLRRPSPPILLCESLPAPCLCQQFGTDSQPNSIHSLLWDPPAKGSASPQTDTTICMPINRSKVMAGQTTRHGTVSTPCANLQRY